MIAIRSEQPQDREAIKAVNQAAFEGEFEARLVDRLRGSAAFIPELSLVAILGEDIVGHILLSVVHIDDGRQRVPIVSLAPMAVLPAHQHKGIGSALVQESLRRCRELGYAVVVLVGHADYYPRFGFVPAGARNLMLPFEAPDEAFMVCELEAGALGGILGEIVYPPEFSEAP